MSMGETMSGIASATSSGVTGGLDLSSQVQVAVAVKARDIARNQGQAAVSLLESAALLQRHALQSGAQTGPGRLDVLA